jgi:hypothetical protein
MQGPLFQLRQNWSPSPRLSRWKTARARCHHRTSNSRARHHFGTAKKLGCPTEPVVPTDERIWNRACLTNVVPQNTAIVSAITLYQLVRLLTTPITLADSIKTTTMVDSGAMGNFIHPRFVELHELVTKTRKPLIVNDMNGRLLSRLD